MNILAFFQIANKRLICVVVVLIFLALTICFRLVQLHIFKHDFLSNQGDQRALREHPIPAHRGMILDRHGDPLAVSTPVVSICANPRKLINSEPEHLELLAEYVGIDFDHFSARLEKNAKRNFMYIKRRMAPSDAQGVLDLNIPGVFDRQEYRRYYPSAEISAQIIGFTNIDDRGQEGVELAMDNVLGGVSGKRQVIRDLKERIVQDVGVVKAAKPGKDIQLTIDTRIQYLAYRELKAAVSAHKAAAGSVVVLDVQSGDILAMVNQPSYNPNLRSLLDRNAVRNRAMLDQIEPGSTIKPFTMAAALSSPKFDINTLVDTSPGYLKIGEHVVKDDRNLGLVDLKTIIKKSSNIGVAKLALNMGPGHLHDTLSSVGFGHMTESGFPGEGAGVMPLDLDTQRIKRTTVSYGYGLSVTPIQLAKAYLILANGGKSQTVSIVRNQDEQEANSQVTQQVLAPEVTSHINDMLVSVVHDNGGTGKRARVPGYTVAGKTGTVHKVGKTGYQVDNYRSLFAGYAPANNPRIVTIVVIDEPNGKEHYGGLVAAPIFSRVVSGVLRLLNVPPERAITHKVQPTAANSKPNVGFVGSALSQVHSGE